MAEKKNFIIWLFLKTKQEGERDREKLHNQLWYGIYENHKKMEKCFPDTQQPQHTHTHSMMKFEFFFFIFFVRSFRVDKISVWMKNC